jgi:hypothetical protein
LDQHVPGSELLDHQRELVGAHRRERPALATQQPEGFFRTNPAVLSDQRK